MRKVPPAASAHHNDVPLAFPVHRSLLPPPATPSTTTHRPIRSLAPLSPQRAADDVEQVGQRHSRQAAHRGGQHQHETDLTRAGGRWVAVAWGLMRTRSEYALGYIISPGREVVMG